jgi:hypothetical protein
MPNRDNTARLADKYELSDLEPDVDPQMAATFLAGGEGNQPKVVRRRRGEDKSPAALAPTQAAVPRSSPQRATKPLTGNTELWTSRTIRLRRDTATGLTKAACGQKVKQAEGKLKPGEPTTVQEIADHAIRLALAELGYAGG